jgi:hypothetical protein
VALWNDKKWVGRTPVVTAVLLEGANAHQLWRMWSEQSALGQSFWGWFQVHIALWLWWNFYRVMTPDQLWARRTAVLSIAINALVVLTVLYFRIRGT